MRNYIGYLCQFILILATGFTISCKREGAGKETSPAGMSMEDAYKSLDDQGIDKIVFIKRPAYNSSHYYTDFIDGMSGFEFGENLGNIFILDLTSGQQTELVSELKGGVFGRYDISFDARRIVFDYKPSMDEGFRIWEINVDGTGLRQLTFDAPDEKERIARFNLSDEEEDANFKRHYDDMHPCYLPDGGIIFTSTRCEYEVLCDGGVLTTPVLHRIDSDGGNMEKLTQSAVSEFSPSVTRDGRVVYSRWEYVDKGSTSIKALWTMYPDGSKTAELYGNNINKPPTFIHGREIPGADGRFVAIGAPHFPQGGVGPVLMIDSRKNIRTREPLHYITPDLDIRGEPGWFFKTRSGWKFDRDGTSGK